MKYKTQNIKQYNQIPEEERKALHMLSRMNNAHLFYSKIIHEAKSRGKDPTQVFLFAESITALSGVIYANIESINKKDKKFPSSLFDRLDPKIQTTIKDLHSDLKDQGKDSFIRNVLTKFRDKIVSHFDKNNYNEIDKELCTHSENLPFMIIDEDNSFSYYNLPIGFIKNIIDEAHKKNLIVEPTSEKLTEEILKLSKELFDINSALIGFIVKDKIVWD